MGVKSTVRLNREEAERRFVEMKLERKRAKYQDKAKALSSVELEDILERWNDEAHEGEGFENYLVSDNNLVD